MLKQYATTLKSSYLLMLVTGVFLFDLFIPDAVPFVDELILFIVTVLLTRWKGRQREDEIAAKPETKDVTPPDEAP